MKVQMFIIALVYLISHDINQMAELMRIFCSADHCKHNTGDAIFYSSNEFIIGDEIRRLKCDGASEMRGNYDVHIQAISTNIENHLEHERCHKN